MHTQKILFHGFLILSAIILLAVLSWRPVRPIVRMHKPSAAIAGRVMRRPVPPPAPLAPAHPKAAIHARVAAAGPAPVVSTRRIVVSLEDRRLALLEDGQVKQIYKVAVGKDSTPSPTGTFTIVKRVENPTYYHGGRVIPPGPNNPVGDRWMGLSKAGYGIHGTNAPRSIGKAASHGCIRMARPDLEQLFAEVRTGDTVEIVGARNDETIALFGAPANPVAPAAAPAVLAQADPQSAPAITAVVQSAAAPAVVAAAIPVGQ
ncbi:MAG TPA: L,D-transpeptidase [Acidobacteriaceae bacterium]|nr:L,D-transpeptidase [Acidobacteriaceae bacterium]